MVLKGSLISISLWAKRPVGFDDQQLLECKMQILLVISLSIKAHIHTYIYIYVDRDWEVYDAMLIVHSDAHAMEITRQYLPKYCFRVVY